MNVIKLADGDYCWFLGSDDVITEGSLDIILHKILLNYNVLLFCRLNCDIKLQPKKIEYILKKGISERTYLLSNRNDLLQYFKDAVDLAATFSYLSVIVVKKSAWDNTPFDISFLGSAYSHVYRLLIMLRKEGTLYYSNRRVVMLRMGNDSFETEKKIERFVLDLNGYQKLGDSIFYDDDLLKYYFWGVLRKTHSWRTLFKARLSVATRKEWSQVENKLINLCFSKTKLFVVRKSYIIIQLIVKIKAL